MEGWLQQLVELLPDGNTYLLVLFLTSFAESIAIIGLLVPGSTIVIFAGFLILQGKGSLLAIIVTSTLGAFLGDICSYWLGFHYGSKLLKLISFQKQHKLIKRAEHFFVDHGGKSIFFARFLGPIRGITPFIAGLSGMTWRPFSCYALISAILWGIAYPGIGYLGGSSWQNVQSLSAKFGAIILIILVAIIFNYWIRRTFKKN